MSSVAIITILLGLCANLLGFSLITRSIYYSCVQFSSKQQLNVTHQKKNTIITRITITSTVPGTAKQTKSPSMECPQSPTQSLHRPQSQQPQPPQRPPQQSRRAAAAGNLTFLGEHESLATIGNNRHHNRSRIV